MPRKPTVKRPVKKTARKYKFDMSKKLNSLVSKKCKNIMARTLETKKQAEETYSSKPIAQVDTGSANGYQLLVFSFNTLYNTVVQGTGQGSRVGNRITVKSSYIKYCISVDPQVSTWQSPGSGTAKDWWLIQPTYVDVYCLKRKDGTIILNGNGYSDLYQFGSETKAPTSTIEDNLLEINKDAYVVLYHRRHKIGAPNINCVADDTTPLTIFSTYDGKQSVVSTVYLTKHIPKHLSYNDDNVQVQNVPALNIFMLCLPSPRMYPGTMYNEGTTQPPGENQPLGINFSANHYINYTDA